MMFGSGVTTLQVVSASEGSSFGASVVMPVVFPELVDLPLPVDWVVLVVLDVPEDLPDWLKSSVFPGSAETVVFLVMSGAVLSGAEELSPPQPLSSRQNTTAVIRIHFILSCQE